MTFAMNISSTKSAVSWSYLFLSYVNALNFSYEESLVKDFKVNGTMKWSWDPESFCASQSPGELTPRNFRRAFVRVVDIRLEWANCAKIQMEALYCEHEVEVAEKKDGHATSSRVRTYHYVNNLGDEIFHVDKPLKSKCNDPDTWIIHYGVFGGVRQPRRLRRFTSFTDIPDSLLQTEELLAEDYQVNGLQRVVWNTELLCRLEIPTGFTFREVYTEERDIMLEWAKCTKIRMEVLQCEYRMEMAMMKLMYESEWHFYANGPRGEIFAVGSPTRSMCDDPVTWTILYEIVADEATSPRASNRFEVAYYSRLLNGDAKERTSVLRKRKWPQFQLFNDDV